MKGELHQGSGLKFLTVLPDEYDSDASYPLIIMLHGFGANMQDLASLAPAINPSGYVYACPNAPVPFDLGYGQVGYGWMPPRGQATPEDVRNAEDLLAGFFDEVFEQFKIDPGNAILMGFSQGGGMTYRCGLSRPETFAGLAALSAALPNPEELKPKLPDHQRQPIFVAHGRYDAQVSMETAQATRDFLQSVGYQPDYHEYNMGHEIPSVVLNDLVPWMGKVLPPRGPDA